MAQFKRQVTSEQLIADLQRVAKEQGRISQYVYIAHGEYSRCCVVTRFVGWNNALRLAGLLDGVGAVSGPPRNGIRPGKPIKPGKPGKFAGPVTCLRCDRVFRSWDRRQNRICRRCKGNRAPVDLYGEPI